MKRYNINDSAEDLPNSWVGVELIPEEALKLPTAVREEAPGGSMLALIASLSAILAIAGFVGYLIGYYLGGA